MADKVCKKQQIVETHTLLYNISFIIEPGLICC